MAQEKVLGDQLNILDVASDISNDSTAIGDIAAGIINDPAAQAAITAGIDHAGLIGVSGSPPTYTHTEIDTHIDDLTIHFVEGDIDHLNILSNGFNTHAQIDTHISNGTIHFVTMDGLLDVKYPGSPGVPLPAQILTWNAGGYWEPVTPIDNDISAIWGNITGTLSDQTDLQAALDLKADVGVFNSHIGDLTIHFTEASIVHQNISGAGTNTHVDIDNHIGTAAMHFTVPQIDHTQMLPISIGTNSHAAIDVHIADTAIHSSTLGGLSDVDTTGAVNGMNLTYDGATWIPQVPAGGQSPLTSDLDTAGFSILTIDPNADMPTNDISLVGGDSEFVGATNSPAGNINLIAGSTTQYGKPEDYTGSPPASGSFPGQINIIGGSGNVYAYDGNYKTSSKLGNVNIKAGNNSHVGSYGYGADVNITSGDGSYGGNIILHGGVTTNTNRSGGVYIYGGYGTKYDTASGTYTPYGHAGGVYITGGNSSGSYAPGDVSIAAGSKLSYNPGAGTGGNLWLQSGGGQGSAGGDVNIITQQGSISGNIFIKCRSSTNGKGGDVSIGSGYSINNGNGGDLSLYAGKATPTGTFNGGNIKLYPGVGGSSGVVGTIDILPPGNTGTGTGRIRFVNKGNSNSVTLGAPDTLTTTVSYNLPGTDGVVGDLLTTNGAGDMSWSSPPAQTTTTIKNVPGVGSPPVFDYVLIISDAANFIVVNDPGVVGNTISIPSNTDVPYPIGTQIEISQVGTGITSIEPESGGGGSPAIVNSVVGNATNSLSQYQTAKLTKITIDAWILAFSEETFTGGGGG